LSMTIILASAGCLTNLPMLRIPLSMKAGEYKYPIWLLDEKQPVRKAPNPSPPPVFLDHGEVQRVCRNSFYRFSHCVGEAYSQFRANLGVPGHGCLQLGISIGQPYDRQRHCLKRSALTCSQGITAEGSCSYLVMRRSSSADCSSLKVGGCASISCQSASKSSNFSATDKPLIWLGSVLMLSA